MTVLDQIDSYIASQPDAKRGELRDLHERIQRISPGCRLWFLDGRDSSGKIVANPNIGYGVQTTTLAGGKSRDFYQVGLSANTTGISIYIMGLADKTLLARTYGDRIGAATVTGYFIKFRTLKGLNLDTLEEAVWFGFRTTAARP